MLNNIGDGIRYYQSVALTESAAERKRKRKRLRSLNSNFQKRRPKQPAADPSSQRQ